MAVAKESWSPRGSTYKTIGHCPCPVHVECGGQPRRLRQPEIRGNITVVAAGVRVLELGDSREVLASVGHTDMDYKSVRAIGEEFGADAVIVGDVEVTDVKPSFDLSGMLTSGTVRADVEAALQSDCSTAVAVRRSGRVRARTRNRSHISA